MLGKRRKVYEILLLISYQLLICKAQDEQQQSDEFVPRNWTAASASGSSTETIYYPAYVVDFSPCPCDLILQSCDIDCCCDSACESNVNCSIGQSSLFRRTETLNTVRSEHSVLLEFASESHILLSLLYITSPHLGYFFPNVPAVRTLAAYGERTSTTVQQQISSLFDDRFAVELLSTPITSTSTSTSSTTITNVRAGTTVVRKIADTLDALPSTGLLGYCGFRSPIRFLQSKVSTCLTPIDTRSCALEPSLNPLSYLLSPFNATSVSGSLTENVFRCRTVLAGQPVDCQRQPMTSVTSPTFDPESCLGVVAEVRVVFVWRGGQIIDTQRSVYLIDATFADRSLTQRFNVTWSHSETAPQSTPVVDPTANGTVVDHEPWIGYRLNDVVYASDISLNRSIDQPMIDLIRQPAETSSDGQCTAEPAAALPVRFGVLSVVACNVRISKADFGDCSRLADRLAEFWSRLYDGVNFVAKFRIDNRPGSIGALRNEDLVAVLRRFPGDMPSSSTPESIDLAPDNNLTLADEYLNFLQNTKSRLSRKIQRQLPVASSRLADFCRSLPTKVILTFLYAEVGSMNGSDINAITGALLKFEEEDWRFSSRFETSQNFLLKSTVKFIKVPAKEPKPIKKYYLTERRDHCPSSLTCWDELFYPFLDINPGEVLAYTKAAGLSAIIIFISIFIVSKPWW